MAKPLPQVSTLADALEYAQSAVKDAFNVCPKGASAYQNVVTMAGQGASVPQLVSALDTANKACHLEKYGTASTSVSTPPPAGGTTPTGTGQPGYGITQKAGFPLWLVLLLGGGALAYYLLSKPKGSSLPRGQRAYYKVRSKVRKAKARRRKPVARRKPAARRKRR